MSASPAVAVGPVPSEEAPRFSAAEGWFAFLLLVCVYFAFSILAVAVLGNPRAKPMTQPAAVVVALALATQMAAGGLAVAWRLRRFAARAYGGSMEAFGFRRARPRQLIFGAVVGLAFGALLTQIAPWFPPPPREPSLLAITGHAGPWPFVIVVAITVCIAPLVEEVVFRGAMWTGFRGSWSAPVAAAVVTVVFVAVHLPQTHGYPVSLVGMTALALSALAVRVRSGSLLPGVLMHSGYNLVLMVQWARQIL